MTMKKSNIEKIVAIKTEDTSSNWQPTIGEEVDGVLNRVLNDDNEAKDKIKEETCRIMALCGNPNKSSNNETGLVFGYVQSGKTLSFTCLTALARDNNYQMVIIIAGISKNLVAQSYERLQKDLNVNKGFKRKWVMLNNPKDPNKNPQDKNTIKRELGNWKNDGTPNNLKKTILITVMKNRNHLRNLILVLRECTLNNVPTLIIDDEGDQASMNTRASANAKREKLGEVLSEVETSTIYRRIRELKEIIPHHTFIQYTATPQAPLFINIMDNLSPNFIQLLTPGDKYTGGYIFFREHPHLVKPIPYSEIYSDDNQFQEVPDSLKDAMRIFFLGVSSGHSFGERPFNRSMMVHPSRLVEKHGVYFNWVESVKNHWAKVLLERGEEDEYRKQIIEEFNSAYKDLKLTVPNLQPFDDLMANMGYYINNTALEQLNSKAGSSVDWRGNYSFILVGGQAMDRGFTVEGLTVTYMPRNKGVGNADTLQQRARFFGYKKDYVGYCRVYLDAENIHLYGEYVDHEEDVRNRLIEHNLSGEHLNNWKRQVVLNEMFKLTRKNVLSDDLERKKFGNSWTRFNAPHDTDFMIENNRTVFNEFIESYSDKFQEDEGHENRTPEQKHFKVELPLNELYQNFFTKLKFTRQSDSSNYTSLNAVLALYTDEFPPESSFVYIINKGNPRERSLNERKNEIKNLFQGKNPRVGRIIYPGDDKIKEVDHVSIQIHNLNIKNEDFNNVITITVWIPERLSKSLVKLKEQ